MYLHICPHAHADNEYGGVRHRQLYTPASTGQPRRFEEESELVNKWLGYHRVMKKNMSAEGFETTTLSAHLGYEAQCIGLGRITNGT